MTLPRINQGKPDFEALRSEKETLEANVSRNDQQNERLKELQELLSNSPGVYDAVVAMHGENKVGKNLWRLVETVTPEFEKAKKIKEAVKEKAVTIVGKNLNEICKQLGIEQRKPDEPLHDFVERVRELYSVYVFLFGKDGKSGQQDIEQLSVWLRGHTNSEIKPLVDKKVKELKEKAVAAVEGMKSSFPVINVAVIDRYSAVPEFKTELDRLITEIAQMIQNYGLVGIREVNAIYAIEIATPRITELSEAAHDKIEAKKKEIGDLKPQDLNTVQNLNALLLIFCAENGASPIEFKTAVLTKRQEFIDKAGGITDVTELALLEVYMQVPDSQIHRAAEVSRNGFVDRFFVPVKTDPEAIGALSPFLKSEIFRQQLEVLFSGLSSEFELILRGLPQNVNSENISGFRLLNTYRERFHALGNLNEIIAGVKIGDVIIRVNEIERIHIDIIGTTDIWTTHEDYIKAYADLGLPEITEALDQFKEERTKEFEESVKKAKEQIALYQGDKPPEVLPESMFEQFELMGSFARLNGNTAQTQELKQKADSVITEVETELSKTEVDLFTVSTPPKEVELDKLQKNRDRLNILVMFYKENGLQPSEIVNIDKLKNLIVILNGNIEAQINSLQTAYALLSAPDNHGVSNEVIQNYSQALQLLRDSKEVKVMSGSYHALYHIARVMRVSGLQG